MSFLASICIAAAASALFKLLVPEEKFSKQLSLLIVCVFLLTGINALRGAGIDLGAEIPELSESEEYVRFSSEINERIKTRVCSEMEEKVRAMLAENEIYPREIHVIVNISGLYGIDITEVKIVLDGGSDAEAARAVLSRGLPGIKTVVETRDV